jgi:hypothetical protein
MNNPLRRTRIADATVPASAVPVLPRCRGKSRSRRIMSASETRTEGISDQRTLVEWWNEHVSVRLRPPGGQSVSADQRSQVSRAIAEAESGIPQQNGGNEGRANRFNGRKGSP